MRILQIVFLLSVCGCPQALRVPITDILEIEKLSKDVTFDLFKMFKLLPKDVGLSAKAKGQSVLFKEFKVFKNKIDMFNVQMGIGSRILYAMVAYTDIQFELKLKLKEVKDKIHFIYSKYEDMGTFIENKTALALLSITLEDLARAFVSDYDNSIQNVLDSIHAIIASSEDGVPSVFEILMDIMSVQGNSMFCETKSSAQQLVLHLYNSLALTELKGFLLIEFSYMLLKLHNQGNFTKEIEAAQERYKDRSGTILMLTIEAVQSAPLQFWKCDPSKQVKNETYIEVTELLQGFIENEAAFSNSWEPCYYTCDTEKDSNSKNCHNYPDNRYMSCNKNRQCKGKLHDCYPMEEVYGGTVCLADAGTNRRYDYIKLEKKMLGRGKDCANNSFGVHGWRHDWYWCNYCICLCDEQGVYSDRYFSLRSSVSDIDHNMVVTGLRFVKKNRIIHLQIQQGKLLPMGKIDVTTVRWKPVEDYKINDRNVFNGLDYHTLTWEKRGFYLDELVRYEGEVLTGVKFQLIGSYLQLQLQMTHFDFATGTLDGNRSLYWYRQPQDRKKVNLNNKDIPIRDPDGSRIFSKTDMYLEFTHSGMDMDVAQTTVPFLDAQDVSLAQPVPLSGAGVMYKGSEKFGGFITLKIMTYNYINVLRNANNDNNYIYLKF